MRVVIESTEFSVSQFAAQRIAQLIRRKPDCVLGFATGSTPLQTYRQLVRMHVADGLDFSRVSTFNLDEYIGLPGDHPESEPTGISDLTSQDLLWLAEHV